MIDEETVIEETVKVIKQKYRQENIGLVNQTIQQTQKMIGECDFVDQTRRRVVEPTSPRLVDQDTLVGRARTLCISSLKSKSSSFSSRRTKTKPSLISDPKNMKIKGMSEMMMIVL